MSRYRGPKVKISRRLGILPGLTLKKSNRNSAQSRDGANNSGSSKKLTEYGIRLQEKQKLKFNYGLTESQLFKYVQEARRRKGVTGLVLIQLLEMRLDTICFTLGFAKTMAQSRQFVTHGNITVNNKVVNIPSFQCHLNDIISIKKTSSLKSLVEKNLEDKPFRNQPNHLKLDNSKLEGTVLDYCDHNDIALKLDELLVIEYYSRR